MAKPILNFKDLLADMKMDAPDFKEKYGIDKQDGKHILDGLWLEQLATFGKEFEVYEDFRTSNFSKSKKEVEIFEPGYHNGKLYTEKDIDTIVKNTKQLMTEQNLTIPIKLGHSEEQEIAKSLFGEDLSDTQGMPALGWVENIKKKGQKIVCDLVKIPDKLFDMMKEHYYDPRSIELWNGFIDKTGKTIGSAITGLALLGAEQPAVSSLASLFDKEGNIKLYSVKAEKENNKKGDFIMTEEVKETVVEEPAKKVEPETVIPEKEDNLDKEEKVEVPPKEEVEKKEELAKKEVEKFDLKDFANEGQVKEALLKHKKDADIGAKAIKDLAEFKAVVAEREKEEIKRKDGEFITAMEKEGRLVPMQSEIMKPLFAAIDINQEVKYFDRNLDVDRNASLKDLVKNFIKSLPNQIEYREFTKSNGKDLTTDLDAATKKYSKEHNIPLGDAYKIVAKDLGRMEELA